MKKLKDTLIIGAVYVLGIGALALMLFGVPDLSSAEDPCWYAEGIKCEESLWKNYYYFYV